MCFSICRKKKERNAARARKIAYKVVLFNPGESSIGGPTNYNTYLRYELGKWYTADKGPQTVGHYDAAHGMYVFLSLDKAKRFARRKSPFAHLYRVRVRGFRQVNYSGSRATFTKIKFFGKKMEVDE